MATANNTTSEPKNATNGAPVDTNSAPAAKDNSDDGFVTIQTQRYMYNVDTCKDKLLQGYCLALINMPPMVMGGEVRAWQAFLIRTTKPTLGVNRKEELVEVGEGEDVLIPATHELIQFLATAANHPTAVFEVKIQADEKLKLDSTRKMWLYKLSSKPQPVRRAQFGLVALPETQLRQLAPAAGGSVVDANWANDPIPF